MVGGFNMFQPITCYQDPQEVDLKQNKSIPFVAHEFVTFQMEIRGGWLPPRSL